MLRVQGMKWKCGFILHSDITLFLFQFLPDIVELQVEKECCDFQHYICNL